MVSDTKQTDKSLNVRDEIENSLKELNLPDRNFTLVRFFDYEKIFIRILNKFTTLGKSGLNYYWWWAHFKPGYVSYPLQEWDYLSELPNLISHDEKLWLIVEDRAKKESPFWLYESNIESIVSVIKDSYGFEFYIVSKKLKWLIAEDHHDVLYGIGNQGISIVEKIKSIQADV